MGRLLEIEWPMPVACWGIQLPLHHYAGRSLNSLIKEEGLFDLSGIKIEGVEKYVWLEDKKGRVFRVVLDNYCSKRQDMIVSPFIDMFNTITVKIKGTVTANSYDISLLDINSTFINSIEEQELQEYKHST